MNKKREQLIKNQFDMLADFLGWEVAEDLDIFKSKDPRISYFRNLAEKLLDSALKAIANASD